MTEDNDQGEKGEDTTAKTNVVGRREETRGGCVFFVFAWMCVICFSLKVMVCQFPGNYGNFEIPFLRREVVFSLFLSLVFAQAWKQAKSKFRSTGHSMPQTSKHLLRFGMTGPQKHTNQTPNLRRYWY